MTQINKLSGFLSAEEIAEIEHEKTHYEQTRAASIEALKIVQQHRGWVPDEAIPEIGLLLDIPACDVEEVATFYSKIYRQPVGRHVISFCDSMVCYINGYQTIQQVLEEKLNIVPGQTTKDGRFTLLNTCCLGACDKGPAMMIDQDTHTHLTADKIDELLRRYP